MLNLIVGNKTQYDANLYLQMLLDVSTWHLLTAGHLPVFHR